MDESNISLKAYHYEDGSYEEEVMSMTGQASNESSKSDDVSEVFDNSGGSGSGSGSSSGQQGSEGKGSDSKTPTRFIHSASGESFDYDKVIILTTFSSDHDGGSGCNSPQCSLDGECMSPHGDDYSNVYDDRFE